MEQPARTTHKHNRTRGEIDFIAPYSLTDCVSRIRSTERRTTLETNSGVDTICEQIAPDAYRFTLTRMWRSTTRNHKNQTGYMVELDGYLKSSHDGLATLVVAKSHVSWFVTLVMIGFAGLAIAGGIFWLKQKSGYLFIGIGIFLVLYYFYQYYRDKRALVRALHRVLSDDLPD